MKTKYCTLTAVLLVCLLLSAALTGCGSKQDQPYTVDLGGSILEVDPVQKRICHGSDVYTYTVSERANSRDYRIFYPDGSTFWWQQQSSGSSGGWAGGNSLTDGEGSYLNPQVLINAIAHPQPASSFRVDRIWISVILWPFGIVILVKPRFFWFWKYGWMFQDAEPSDMGLFMTRIGGGALILLGLLGLFA